MLLERGLGKDERAAVVARSEARLDARDLVRGPRDRLGRRAMFRLFGAGFILSVTFYLLAPLGNSAWTLLPAGMVYGFFQFGIYASFGPYFTELFPMEMRGTGQAFAFVGADNASISELVVQADGRWRIRRFNDIAHLV